MPANKVLLLQPIEGLGAEGEEVVVKPGYARNYLIPRKLAIPMTQANRKQMDALRVRRAEREAKELEGAQALANKIQGTSIVFAVKTGEGGKMFGAITAGDLHEKLAESGIEIDKKKVSLDAPVKTLGQHSTTIKVHAQAQAELTFEIVSENPIEEAAEEETVAQAE
ncbi:MAG: 50S ribosomal protein L9 [Opitutales bacterium]|nr:50S ribosomal protein L9 [Opitutales bacterium]NRA26512.1 50S ribosomal protein L9 [Opitutales bacterium]